ncbi:hypothetical protein [Nonomuraea sp. NPDC049480]|uniref:hypothetical protein n=1 Tax=Nonomuraea sp. NPDC049480 TaxID=3364353 RepID=UPI003789A64E
MIFSGTLTGSHAWFGDRTDALRVCYEQLVEPHRLVIETAAGRDRRIRTSAFARGGVEGMLASLRPMMSWSAGELCVPGHRGQEWHLRGRGLLLVPSYFCVGGPLTMLDPELPPVLVYPVQRGVDVLPYNGAASLTALDALAGTTGAAVLDAVGAGEGNTPRYGKTGHEGILKHRVGPSSPSTRFQA